MVISQAWSPIPMHITTSLVQFRRLRGHNPLDSRRWYSDIIERPRNSLIMNTQTRDLFKWLSLVYPVTQSYTCIFWPLHTNKPPKCFHLSDEPISYGLRCVSLNKRNGDKNGIPTFTRTLVSVVKVYYAWMIRNIFCWYHWPQRKAISASRKRMHQLQHSLSFSSNCKLKVNLRSVLQLIATSFTWKSNLNKFGCTRVA